jgi:hypothetical protein
VQEPELYVHEEQKDHDGALGVEEVLSPLPEAATAQGNQVKWIHAVAPPVLPAVATAVTTESAAGETGSVP